MSDAVATISENLLVALLSVNQWSVEKVYGLVEGFREAGLFDFDSVARLDEAELTRRLGTAGYNRGTYLTPMMASRVGSLAGVLKGGTVRKLADFIASGDRESAENILKLIDGVGPFVLRNFWLLQKS
jgi:hypothetical protein